MNPRDIVAIPQPDGPLSVLHILSRHTITTAQAELMLASYPMIDEVLAGIAATVERRWQNATIRRETLPYLVDHWTSALDGVNVGYVSFETTRSVRFRAVRVYIDKPTGLLLIDDDREGLADWPASAEG